MVAKKEIQYIHIYAIESESPFREYRIHMRKPLNVNARGITNRSKTRADVDSNSNSTMPTAYSTDHLSVSDANGISSH